jgi:hypothetical protein
MFFLSGRGLYHQTVSSRHGAGADQAASQPETQAGTGGHDARPEKNMAVTEMLETADQKLYEAKEDGRNAVKDIPFRKRLLSAPHAVFLSSSYFSDK